MLTCGVRTTNKEQIQNNIFLISLFLKQALSLYLPCNTSKLVIDMPYTSCDLNCSWDLMAHRCLNHHHQFFRWRSTNLGNMMGSRETKKYDKSRILALQNLAHSTHYIHNTHNSEKIQSRQSLIPLDWFKISLKKPIHWIQSQVVAPMVYSKVFYHHCLQVS